MWPLMPFKAFKNEWAWRNTLHVGVEHARRQPTNFNNTHVWWSCRWWVKSHMIQAFLSHQFDLLLFFMTCEWRQNANLFTHSSGGIYQGFLTRIVYLYYNIMLEMHHSGREPSIYSVVNLLQTAKPFQGLKRKGEEKEEDNGKWLLSSWN